VRRKLDTFPLIPLNNFQSERISMSVSHLFNVEIACKIGIEKAILLQNIEFWIAKNKANNQNIYDGKCYTYNSYKAFAELFPYMKINTIKRCLVELENEGFIETRDDLNESKWDKTKWYHRLSDVTFDSRKNDVRETENNPSIETENNPHNSTDINTDINTDNKHIISSEKKKLPPKKPTGYIYPKEYEALWSKYRQGDKWNGYRAYTKAIKQFAYEDLLKAIGIEKSKTFGHRHLSTLLQGDLEAHLEGEEQYTKTQHKGKQPEYGSIGWRMQQQQNQIDAEVIYE